MPTTTYREAADKGFDQLNTLWGDGAVFVDNIGQGFWHAGNTLHTCVNYLLLDGVTADRGVVEKSYALFDKYRDKGSDPAKWKAWWRDDYGWWGVSLLLAYNNAAKLGLADPARYLDAAHACWQGLQTAWDDVEGGGCWNNPDPHGNGLKRKNSVTNELFFRLSLELSQAPDAPQEDYRGWATKERDWFGGWAVARTLVDADGLVYETPGKAYDPTWVWTADQGMYAAAFVRAVDVLGSSAPPTDKYDFAVAIVKAVSRTLLDGGVLHESTTNTDLGYDVDYATGKGVFFRYVTEVPTDYADHITTNAAAVWNNRPDAGTNQFGFNWNPAAGNHEPDGGQDGLWPITLQIAGLDVLVSAARIAPDAEIPPSP